MSDMKGDVETETKKPITWRTADGAQWTLFTVLEDNRIDVDRWTTEADLRAAGYVPALEADTVSRAELVCSAPACLGRLRVITADTVSRAEHEAALNDLLDIAESTRGDWTSRTDAGGKAMLYVSGLLDQLATERARAEEAERRLASESRAHLEEATDLRNSYMRQADELATTNARAARLEEALTAAANDFSLSGAHSHVAAMGARAALSTAPQASTEQASAHADCDPRDCMYATPEYLKPEPPEASTEQASPSPEHENHGQRTLDPNAALVPGPARMEALRPESLRGDTVPRDGAQVVPAQDSDVAEEVASPSPAVGVCYCDAEPPCPAGKCPNGPLVVGREGDCVGHLMSGCTCADCLRAHGIAPTPAEPQASTEQTDDEDNDEERDPLTGQLVSARVGYHPAQPAPSPAVGEARDGWTELEPDEQCRDCELTGRHFCSAAAQPAPSPAVGEVTQYSCKSLGCRPECPHREPAQPAPSVEAGRVQTSLFRQVAEASVQPAPGGKGRCKVCQGDGLTGYSLGSRDTCQACSGRGLVDPTPAEPQGRPEQAGEYVTVARLVEALRKSASEYVTMDPAVMVRAVADRLEGK